MQNGESRGSPQANDATMGNVDMALLGIGSGTDLINDDKADSACGYK